MIIKLFLCIDKKEQKKRFHKLMESKSSAWRVSEGDLKRNKEYNRYKEMNEEMLQKTDSDYAPWTIVEATQREFATVKIYSDTRSRVPLPGGKDPAGTQRKKETGRPGAGTKSQWTDESTLKTSSLNSVDLTLSYTKEEYKEKLDRLQNRIQELHGELYREEFR